MCSSGYAKTINSCETGETESLFRRNSYTYYWYEVVVRIYIHTWYLQEMGGCGTSITRATGGLPREGDDIVLRIM